MRSALRQDWPARAVGPDRAGARISPGPVDGLASALLPKSGAYATMIDGRVLILDVAKDRYYLASAPGLRRAGAVAGSEDGVIHSTYADLGLGATRADSTLRPVGRFRLRPAVHSLSYLRAVSRTLARESFQTFVESIRATPVRSKKGRLSAETLLASFAAARPFFGEATICRLDAPALCLLMRHYGHGARLMFGARLEPFRAHCWTELDGAVLNESHEHIRQFSPVLAV